MNVKRSYRLLFIFFLLITNISCDQVSKAIVRQRVDYHENIPLIDSYFTLTRVENTGAFLSLGNALPNYLKIIILSLLPMLVIGFGIFYLSMKQEVNKIGLIGFCFIIGGGIGNIFDRIVYGSVTDFLHIKVGILQTGVFNLADVSIMIGTGIILAFSFLKHTS